MWAAEQGGPERSTVAMFLSPGASFDPDQHSDRTEPSDFQDKFTFTQRFLDEKKGDYWRLCAFEPSLHTFSVTDERTFVEKMCLVSSHLRDHSYCRTEPSRSQRSTDTHQVFSRGAWMRMFGSADRAFRSASGPCVALNDGLLAAGRDGGSRRAPPALPRSLRREDSASAPGPPPLPRSPARKVSCWRATDQEPSSSLCGGTVNPSSPLLLLMQWRRRSWRG
ncbi:uncharacterized protein LOC119027670 isoform X1 [Acanthopagrus latus]|uniref:uncharacterized protein LOC119027670 isoform X1 n=1 Tax=Acanthopagrus latus TaxID=8177 RepID=UPI00187C9F43|nr:uncharacterized protein LOC119027670 isoform X1 [Acanthopagrus latus]